MTSVTLNSPAEHKLSLFPRERFALDREERLSDGGQGEVVGSQAGGEARVDLRPEGQPLEFATPGWNRRTQMQTPDRGGKVPAAGGGRRDETKIT